MEGQILDGRYEILRELGRGGMGSVWEARHTGTGRRVAVKVITADLLKSPGLVARFEVEARAGGGIDSQYIAQVLDTGTDQGLGAPYIVMEFLVGEDLYQLLARLAPIPVELALRITAQACLGLEKAHQAKIIHRDIKPANIFLNEREGDELGVKILDFGVAKIKAEEGQSVNVLTRTGSLLGSPLYMSPEQARGDKTIDQRSDLWSLGVVLYEQLCGRTPFHDIEALGSLIIAICSDPPRPIQELAPWVPPDVASIVHKALRLNPAERFQSAHEMYRAIKAVLTNGSHSIDKAMLTPMSAEQRGYVAPTMTVAEPALASSGPGVYDDAEPTVRAPSSLLADGGGAARESKAPSPARESAPNASAAAAPPPAASVPERMRTTAGVTSEPARSAPPPAARSKAPIAIGAAAAVAIAVVAAVRFAGSGPTPQAAPAQAATPAAAVAEKVAEKPAEAPHPTATAASTTTPVVAPVESATAEASATSAAKTPDAGAPLGPPRLGKSYPKTAPTAAPATTSVGGRIIRTDL